MITKVLIILVIMINKYMLLFLKNIQIQTIENKNIKRRLNNNIISNHEFKRYNQLL